jgi:hypothetical protein
VSTRIIGIRRRAADISSRAAVSAFSLVNIASNEARHSAGETTSGSPTSACVREGASVM